MTEPSESRPTSEPNARRWRPRISVALTAGFGVLLVIAVGSVGWLLLDAGRRNTFGLLRESAEITLYSIEAQLEQHLGAAARQAAYLAERVAEGMIEPSDSERMVEFMLGALAATPQVNGIAFINAELDSLRVGRKDGTLTWLRSDWSERAEIARMIESIRDAGPYSWLGVAWIEDFQEPHVAIVAPAHRNGVYLGSFSSVVSLRALSGFLATLDEGLGTHSFILYGRDRVLAHPALTGAAQGLSEQKPLHGLDEIGDPVLGDIWAPGYPLVILENSSVQGRSVQGPDDEQIYIYREIDDYDPLPWTVGVYFQKSTFDSN